MAEKQKPIPSALPTLSPNLKNGQQKTNYWTWLLAIGGGLLVIFMIGAFIETLREGRKALPTATGVDITKKKDDSFEITWQSSMRTKDSPENLMYWVSVTNLTNGREILRQGGLTKKIVTLPAKSIKDGQAYKVSIRSSINGRHFSDTVFFTFVANGQVHYEPGAKLTNPASKNNFEATKVINDIKACHAVCADDNNCKNWHYLNRQKNKGNCILHIEPVHHMKTQSTTERNK